MLLNLASTLFQWEEMNPSIKCAANWPPILGHSPRTPTILMEELGRRRLFSGTRRTWAPPPINFGNGQQRSRVRGMEQISRQSERRVWIKEAGRATMP